LIVTTDATDASMLKMHRETLRFLCNAHSANAAIPLAWQSSNLNAVSMTNMPLVYATDLMRRNKRTHGKSIKRRISAIIWLFLLKSLFQAYSTDCIDHLDVRGQPLDLVEVGGISRGAWMPLPKPPPRRRSTSGNRGRIQSGSHAPWTVPIRIPAQVTMRSADDADIISAMV